MLLPPAVAGNVELLSTCACSLGNWKSNTVPLIGILLCCWIFAFSLCSDL